jgi:hypothetical protein
LGGYWRGAAGGQIGGSGSGANQGRLKQQFQQDSVIYVSGTTKFDNGLNVGVMVQFRGEGANSVNETLQKDNSTVRGGQDTVKRSYVRFFGDFGEIRFGDDEDARIQKSFTAPQAGSLFGVNTPFFAFTNNPVGTNNTELPITVKRAQRIAYFSPNIAGFSFAASYQPTSQKGILGPIGFQSTTGVTVAGQESQSWSVGGLYENKFGDFRLQAFGGMTGGRTIGGGFNNTVAFAGGATTTVSTTTAAGSASNQNKFAWNGGLNVGWGPIQVGSTFEHVSNSRLATGFSNQNDNVFDAGVLYTIGPFSASLDWSHGQYKGFAVAGDATARLDMVQLIADYVLGPGVSVGAMLGYDRYISGVTATAATATQNEHDWEIALGTAFTF